MPYLRIDGLVEVRLIDDAPISIVGRSCDVPTVDHLFRMNHKGYGIADTGHGTPMPAMFGIVDS